MSVCRFCPGYECTKRLIYRILREIYFFVDIKGAKFAEKVEFFLFFAGEFRFELRGVSNFFLDANG